MNRPPQRSAKNPTLSSGTAVQGRARAPGAPLGGLSVDEFLRVYWQRKPLLVRAALPDIKPPCGVAELIELAGHDEVQSRLVSSYGGRWQLAHGPFEADQLPPLSRRRWTLLVQGVNLHVDAAHQLMSRFRFLPDARLDDLMISLASDQGGVGPHLDSYDVFLVQLWGRRRWRIAPPGNDQLRPGLPLKILETFTPTDTWVLEPGDMLYLPPGWAHDGIAEGPCMTGSIGFRAPSRHEFLREFLADAADVNEGPDPRFADPGRRQTRQPAAIPEALHKTMLDWAQSWRPSRAAVDDFIGRFLTEPPATVFFDPPARPSSARFFAAIERKGLRLDRRTRLLYRGTRFYINGETIPTLRDRRATALLARLADQRQLNADEARRALANSELAHRLFEWAEAGWLHAGTLQPGSGQTSVHSNPAS